MDRRDFLRLIMAGAAGSVLAGLRAPFTSAATLASAGPLAHAKEAPPPTFVVAHGPSVARNLRSAVDALGGISRYISRGDVVVVKPNIGWDRVPEQAANTDPALVYSMVEMCFQAGAKKVKVFDRSCDDPRRCYVKSGIADSARKAGAEVKFVDERDFRQINMHGAVLDKWPIYSAVLDCDKVINVPVAKQHGMSRLSMSVKNWMGVIGDPRGKLHQQIDLSLADLAHFFKPTLTVLDATRILVANGPQGGNIKDVRRLNTLVVGTDQLAVDSYGATFFGLKGSDLGYLVKAAKAGVGEIDLKKVRFSSIEVT
ncbi:MAG: DUF362 domain-containing protein [Candidatus Eisenbacteria bacterium]|nr:DUF362 domain-containing protein [Candidatus Eisenbacteria bacterium]